ncbi:MAG: U32 family peptidase [Oscillospiraceae bacterium]|nr:U32 family peptidase [Oscillospiraceae bacterium]
MKKIELLAPAGDMEKLNMAVRYGADAVYLAGTSFGMRSFAGNFSPEELPRAVALAHAHGVRVHVTVNTMARSRELDALPPHLELLDASGADALIVADLGAFRMAQRYAPRCELHMSTQVSIANYASASAWYELGAKRVVLARELSLEEIAEIRAKAPKELELEVFAHGAMCVSYSGRCLLSNYMTGRDSNRGACAQPCRYQYYLMEEKRPGEYFPVFEDETGTYIMNSRDMCMIDHLEDLMRVGVDCIKIEGRAKSAYYAAIVTGAYRHVLDDVAAGRPIDPVWRNEVEKISHRHYSTGFFYGQPGQYYEDSRYIREYQVVAIVTDCDAEGNALLSLRNKFSSGDEIEAVGPDLRPFCFPASSFHTPEGELLTEVRIPQMLFRMKLPRAVPPYTILRRQADLSAK